MQVAKQSGSYDTSSCAPVAIDDARAAPEHSQKGWFDDWLRYIRLYGLIVRTCLFREMTFRGNFLLRLVSHVIWLSLMLAFLR
jgi:hypothetical protein